MRQSDHEYEERSFGDIQRAIDFENSMNDLESQLYYQHLSPKEVAQQVLKATCQFYDADWCGLIQVDLDLNLWTPFWWFNAGATDKTMLLTEEYTRFAWVGEIKNEQLHSALEKLSEDDLMLVSLYVYEGFDTVEISKVFGTTKQNISKKIRRITNFIKNFQIKVV